MALTFVRGKDVVIVLDEENVERIGKNDPFMLDMAKMGTYTVEFPLRIHICYARKDDAVFKEYIEQQDMDALLTYLSRGFQVRDGDYDGSYKHFATIKGR